MRQFNVAPSSVLLYQRHTVRGEHDVDVRATLTCSMVRTPELMSLITDEFIISPVLFTCTAGGTLSLVFH